MLDQDIGRHDHQEETEAALELYGRESVTEKASRQRAQHRHPGKAGHQRVVDGDGADVAGEARSGLDRDDAERGANGALYRQARKQH